MPKQRQKKKRSSNSNSNNQNSEIANEAGSASVKEVPADVKNENLSGVKSSQSKNALVMNDDPQINSINSKEDKIDLAIEDEIKKDALQHNSTTLTNDSQALSQNNEHTKLTSSEPPKKSQMALKLESAESHVMKVQSIIESLRDNLVISSSTSFTETNKAKITDVDINTHEAEEIVEISNIEKELKKKIAELEGALQQKEVCLEETEKALDYQRITNNDLRNKIWKASDDVHLVKKSEENLANRLSSLKEKRDLEIKAFKHFATEYAPEINSTNTADFCSFIKSVHESVHQRFNKLVKSKNDENVSSNKEIAELKSKVTLYECDLEDKKDVLLNVGELLDRLVLCYD